MIDNIVTIDQQALADNLAQVKSLAPHSKILAMIKSDGYGHGAVAVASALKAADGFGVARLSEAIQLREAGIAKPILLMGGFFAIDELPEVVYYDLSIVLQNHWQLNALISTPLNKLISIWLKINTGMNRLGVSLQDVDILMSALERCAWIKKPINLMTHLSDADDMMNHKSEEQIHLFLQAVAKYPGEKSIANSATLLNFPLAHSDWVRPGIMLYGISPIKDKVGHDLGLKPAMTLSSRIIAIQNVRAGEAVGYASTWVAKRDSKIAVVAIGYGDGYPWSAKTGTPVLIKGKTYPLVGRVSMDMLSVDITDSDDIQIGDAVILWGENLPIEIIAKFADTIPYELILKLTSRVKHVIQTTS